MTKTITLDHGSGGKASHQLVQEVFINSFDNQTLSDLEDSALLKIGQEKLAFSTDSFVVDPIFFDGGCIGDLAVNGTVNDLAMRGARPLYLSIALILEEGLPIDDLKRIITAAKFAADKAGVEIVAGDTKVVPTGKADKIFINTTGIGIIEHDYNISGTNAQDGDHVIISGTIADHGVTILCLQEGLKIKGGFKTDSASLNELTDDIIKLVGANIHVLRDPTRGGVATTLNEIAESSQVGIELMEEDLPIRDDVRGACELLGLDPLYLANEGKMLVFVHPDYSAALVNKLQNHEFGKDSAIIGRVTAESPGRVTIKSGLGTSRLLDMLHGTPLPRIC